MKAAFPHVKKSWSLALIVLIYPLTYAEPVKQDSARAVRAQKLADFYSLNPDVRIEINPVTGVPEDIWGDISRYQNESDAVEAAYEFFEQNKELYGMSHPRTELKLQGKANKYGWMVDFKQTYKGVEIDQSSLRAYFTPAGKLKGIMGGFAQIPELSTTPSIDSASAIQIVKRDINYTIGDEKKVREMYDQLKSFGIKATPPLPSTSLNVMAINEKYYLVWVVQVSQGLFHDWQYLIDAHSGNILDKGDWAEGEHFPRGKSLPGDSSSAQPQRNMAPVPKPVPEKEQENPKIKLERVPEDSGTVSKQIPRQESSSPSEPAPITL